MNPISLSDNPDWQLHPETLEVVHCRSGISALTFTLNRQRVAKITNRNGKEIIAPVPVLPPPGLLTVPGYPDYGFSQAEGKVYRLQGGWATFQPRAVFAYPKPGTGDHYVWLIPTGGKKKQLGLSRIALAISQETGLDFAWLCQNLPEGNHSGPSGASDPEPNGEQTEAYQQPDADALPETPTAPDPFNLYPEGDPRWEQGEPRWEQGEPIQAPDIPVTPPTFSPRIF